MSSYSVVDVAAMLKVNEETVRRWIREGKLVATLKRGRGGSSIELEDVIKFVNHTPGGHSYLAIKKWLRENDIKFSETIQSDNNSSVLQTAAKLAGSSAIGLSLGGPVGGLIGGALGSALGIMTSEPQYKEQIILQKNQKETDPITPDVKETEHHIQDRSTNSDVDLIMDTPKPVNSYKDDINKKIIAEQKKLLRLQQELAQINAQISIAEAEIEYYKLLLTEQI